MNKYIVKCPGCGEVRDPYALHCPDDDALPRTEYFKKQIEPTDMREYGDITIGCL